MKRILAIDGGGIRGIIPTVVLRAFETYTGRNCIDMFDLLVGTSTGGLITLGLAHPNQFGAERLLELFKDKGAAIFDKPRGSIPQKSSWEVPGIQETAWRKSSKVILAKHDSVMQNEMSW